MNVFREIAGQRELLLILVQRNIKIRYKGSLLGFVWTLASPVFLILVYMTFLRIMRFGIRLDVLVTGIIAWQFLGMSLGDSLHAVIGNANLVKKTYFPRIILPVAGVMANLVNFLLSLAVLVVFLLLVGTDFGPLYWLAPALLSQVALCIGVTLIFAAANVFFRDTEHILGVLTLAWFFLTPVIYGLEVPLAFLRDSGLPAASRYLLFLNPMVGILSAYRHAFLSEQACPPAMFLISFAVSWAVLLAGIAIFQKVQPLFADEL